MEILVTATEAWLNHLNNIVIFGHDVEIKGQNTLELINQSLSFDMNYPIIYNAHRKMNYQFMAAEADFICNGDNRVSALSRYNKNIEQFSDDGLIFNGNYGEPFNFQLEYAARCLIDDLTSRQSVITIWQANPVKSKDIRCTLSLQFLIRNNKINTIVNMRSSDIIWGVCYDVFNFTVMTLRILTRIHQELPQLNIELGNLYLNMGSSHLYERHFNLVDTILGFPIEDDKESIKKEIKVPVRALKDWSYVAGQLFNNKESLATDWIMDPNKI